MSDKIPPSLYRFRWLDNSTFDREMQALEQSYLYSPSFSAMNDPMEAFYETGGPGDRIVDAMLSPSGKTTAEIYRLLDETIAKFALVSFTGTFEALPLWAYYANNFAGMCLEFATDQLFIGDFQGEKLHPVTYAREALPPIGMNDLASHSLENAMTARITRKRIEWAHEKEWRLITGAVGPKYFIDDALKRVYLGPRIAEGHVDRICQILTRRPVEILQGKIHGFELEFETIQEATPLKDCERIGEGRFDPTEDLYAEKELREFLGSHYEKLVEECKQTVLRPNVQQLAGIDLSAPRPGTIYFHTMFKLRNGREVYYKRYFDEYMREVP